VQQMRMDLLYASKFDEKAQPMPEAYERLLLEVLANDHSHFVSAEELMESWRIFTPLLHKLASDKVKPHLYPYGSRGPAAADALAHKYGLTKFGGGITAYVEGEPPRKYSTMAGDETAAVDDENSDKASVCSNMTNSFTEAASGEPSPSGGLQSEKLPFPVRQSVMQPPLGPPPSAASLAAISSAAQPPAPPPAATKANGSNGGLAELASSAQGLTISAPVAPASVPSTEGTPNGSRKGSRDVEPQYVSGK